MSTRADKAFQILAARGVWEARQRVYYQIRHDGLRRQNKPFPTASDSHFPLVDGNISDLKPFWVGHVFGGQRLCDFQAMRQQGQEMTESAADFHDFELRHRTKYRLKMEVAIDTMLLRGRGVLKFTVDPFNGYAIKCTAIDPVFILMPQNAKDFPTDHMDDDGADYWYEVQKLTVAQYQRIRNYNQSPDVLRAIRGNANAASQLSAIYTDKQIREGVTHSANEDEIMLWHEWKKTSGGFTITTFSPQAPDKEIRKPYGCAYKVDGKVSCPYHSITMEIKDEGWYAARGVAELNAAFEAYCTKLWNEKSDAMTFGNRPLFTSTDNNIQNTGNLRFMPGEFIPGGITAVQMPPPAFSFAEEINFTREVAERRAKTPDFGIKEQGDNNEARTATENNRIASMQDVGVDHNGDMLRERLQRIYKHTWGLMVQFKGRELSYRVAEDLKILPQQALHDQYMVIPDGASGTKRDRLMRATNRYAMFKGDPGINQDELKKDVLAADDPRLVKRLLIPMDQAKGQEAEDEAKEIVIMKEGWPAVAGPNEDHVTRLGVLVGWMQKQITLRIPVDPLAMQRVQQHIAQHFMFLKQQNPQGAAQLAKQIQQLEFAHGAAVNPRGMQPAQNGAPM